MTDCRSNRANLLPRTLGCVLVVGALTTGSFAATSAIANAQPVSLPVVGNVDISIPPQLASLLQPAIVPLQVPPQPEAPPVLQIESRSPVVPPFGVDPIQQAPLPLPAPTHGQQAPLPLPAPTHGQQALSAAESKLGAPYVWGATGPDAFDCSGLAQWAYVKAGVSIPRSTYDQAVGGTLVSQEDLEPGDLVLFYGGEHVGLYAGNGEVVHAPTSGQSVKRAPLDSMPFYLARRY